jgi:hypothetical protein
MMSATSMVGRGIYFGNARYIVESSDSQLEALIG